MGGERSARWARAAKLAARQHGVATRAQLLDLEITARVIERRLEDGRLRALHRGVYLLGPNRGALTYEMAAVLACGPFAALSHHPAGHIWKLLPYLPKRRLQHVSVTRGNPRSRSGIRIHRTVLSSHELTTKHNIPITTPARTVLDLASELADDHLEQAIAEAFARHRVTKAKLQALIERHPRQRGGRRLRENLGGTPALTRSRAERRLLTLIRQAGLPEPEVNARVGRWEVDLLWREHRLAVEIDGYDSHSSPRAFERDYRKNAELEAAGLRVLRVSAAQAGDQAGATLARITRQLAL
jgi:very-short-patch-repair endonuclease